MEYCICNHSGVQIYFLFLSCISVYYADFLLFKEAVWNVSWNLVMLIAIALITWSHLKNFLQIFIQQSADQGNIAFRKSRKMTRWCLGHCIFILILLLGLRVLGVLLESGIPGHVHWMLCCKSVLLRITFIICGIWHFFFFKLVLCHWFFNFH